MTSTTIGRGSPKKSAKPVKAAKSGLTLGGGRAKEGALKPQGKTIKVRHFLKVRDASTLDNSPKFFRTFRREYGAAPIIERVRIERMGVPFEVVQGMVVEIGMSDAEFQRTVGIPKATFAKKMKEGTPFDGVVGQSAIHIMELVNKVEEMVSVDPDPEAIKGFDAAKWVGEWIRTPQPGLGGATPAELLDTPTGREAVMRLLGSMQSGSYQ